jgi:hypothetical protein
LVPQTAFYDWLYINALQQQIRQGDAVMDYAAFTDIEFNPKVSINCQARSVALYVALRRLGILGQALESSSAFIAYLAGARQASIPVQPSLF